MSASLFSELAYAAGPRNRSRSGHVQAFAEWLSLPLNCQAAELQRYLEEMDTDPLETLRCWMLDHWYEQLVPKEARPHERLLFTSDMEILLPLLYQQATGVAGSDSPSSFLQWVGSIRTLPRKLGLAGPAKNSLRRTA